MNGDRRTAVRVCIALLHECAEIGEISDESHAALTDALKSLKGQEYWQLRNQERHAGKNDPTDRQISICRVALPALDSALTALAAEDYDTVLQQLDLAITTDGTPPNPARRKK